MTSEPINEPEFDPDVLNRDLVRRGGLWREIMVVERTGSTNSDLLRAARRGAGHGLVLIAGHQEAGRGRRDRGFVTPSGTALTFSMLLRPQVPGARAGWLPLMAGVAAVQAVARTSPAFAEDRPELWLEPLAAGRVEGGPSSERCVGVKWPNDVLVTVPGPAEELKLAGILSEAVTDTRQGTAVVIGIGLNVRQSAGQLPTPTAASLVSLGLERADRASVLRALLAEFAERYTAWQEHEGDADACGLAEDYRRDCLTLGRRVRLHLLGGRAFDGAAEDVDAAGRLLVRDETGAQHPFTAGDVVHLR